MIVLTEVESEVFVERLLDLIDPNRDKLPSSKLYASGFVRGLESAIVDIVLRRLTADFARDVDKAPAPD